MNDPCISTMPRADRLRWGVRLCPTCRGKGEVRMRIPLYHFGAVFDDDPVAYQHEVQTCPTCGGRKFLASKTAVADYVGKTDKAFCFKIAGKKVWVAKRLVARYEFQSHTLIVPHWADLTPLSEKKKAEEFVSQIPVEPEDWWPPEEF